MDSANRKTLSEKLAAAPDDLEVIQFKRKSFPVGAVQVTEANMSSVAKWCGGTIEDAPNNPAGDKFVKVDVHMPMTDRQTQAFVGDYVLFAETGRGFKVYTERAFSKSFERVTTPEGITVNVFTASGESAVAAAGGGGGHFSKQNPGGTPSV